MKLSARRRYILLAAGAYGLLALAWIFLSDRLLMAFVDIEALIRLSTAKGVFFVLVSAAVFFVALHAVPPETGSRGEPAAEGVVDILTTQPWPRWLTYIFAVVLVWTMLLVRNQMPVAFRDRPLLILFMLPIILAALLGGLGPGLVATLTAAALTGYYLLPPTHGFAIAANHDLFQWGLLLVNGLVVGLISETMRRARRRERARGRQLEAANTALRQSEERFRRLFDDAPVAMALTDTDGTILARNEGMRQLFGYTSEDVGSVADWWVLAYPNPDYRAQVEQKWDAALARLAQTGEATDAGEYRVTCKDGSERIVHIFSIMMPAGLLTAFLDETERYQAETRLRLWAESFEQAELGLIITDARNNTIIAVNPAFARQRGYEREQMTGMPVRHLFPPDHDPDFRNIISTMRATTHGMFETEHIARDGRRFPVLIDVTVTFDQDGRPLHRVAYVLDITDRKQAEQALATALEQQKQGRIAALNQMQDANAARASTEEALASLRESEERLSLFIEHAPAALAMFDRELRYLAASRRWRDDFFLGEQDILGRCHYEIFPEITAEIKAVHRRGLAGEVVRADEDRFVRPDGRVQWLRWEMRPWHTAEGAIGGIVIFTEDITRFKQAEEEIRRLNVDLERRVVERTAELTAANRELDSFAYAVSHDLRAPLRAMNGFSQALIEDYGDTLQGEARLYLDQIIVGSRKMGELIDGLLTLSRSTRGQMMHREQVDLSRMAARMLEEMARMEPERRVHWELEPDLIVRGDAAMLEVVMHNLLANAWKYSSRRDQAVIRVFAQPSEAGRAICVADNGAGFEAAHAQKLFQPFQRLHRQEEFPGIGIGLATVQRIIHRHGGTLTAEGEKDQGALFRFTLPRNNDQNQEDVRP